jgi:hypothetical protein
LREERDKKKERKKKSFEILMMYKRLIQYKVMKLKTKEIKRQSINIWRMPSTKILNMGWQ